MHDKGRILINEAMKKQKLKGIDKECKYQPCHDGLEDCTFCYCPFYPCNQNDTGGFEKISSRTGQMIWACSSCIFVHKAKNSEKILIGLIELNTNFNSISREELLKLRSQIISQKRE